MGTRVKMILNPIKRTEQNNVASKSPPVWTDPNRDTVMSVTRYDSLLATTNEFVGGCKADLCCQIGLLNCYCYYCR